MDFQSGGKITEGYVYSVELSSSQEVAEYGYYAEKTKLALPEWFDIDNEEKLNVVFDELKKRRRASSRKFDTVVIKKESIEEWVFHIEGDGENEN